MGFVGSKASVCLLAHLLFMAFCNRARGSFCQKLSLQDAVSIPPDQCLYDGNQFYVQRDSFPSRVSEMNGTTLERSLKLLQSRTDAYVAVLFYADWCPFSGILRPIFDVLATNFPAIHHAAVEESALYPSTLSQYGVYSFPALVLHNKTLKVRYYGSRTLEAIGQFYKDITGLQPTNPINLGTDGVVTIEKTSTDGMFQSNKEYPASWTTYPKKVLHDDKYLPLATCFLVLRIFFYVLPKILTDIKLYWIRKEMSQQAHKGQVRRGSMLNVEQKQNTESSRKRSKGKSTGMEIMQETKEVGKGVLSVPSWSSSSLAAVTLAESSSSRAIIAEDARDNGHAYRSHLWS